MPSAVNSTYAVRIRIFSEATVHLFGRGGGLCRYAKWATVGEQSQLVAKDVNYIKMSADSDTPKDAPRTLVLHFPL